MKLTLTETPKTGFLVTRPIYVDVLLLSTDYEDKGAVAISLNDTNSLSKDADPEKDDHGPMSYIFMLYFYLQIMRIKGL